ncbi:hypothetical protein BYT27DRAFT_7258250 [Phlegmacium glaucopus]|nr:hypothetical protein BYT27DRAFT_7258250 [Phlegmacium glaucopus]
MGKGKNKAFKLKEYKVPPEKYVVVVNAWGLPDKLDMNTKMNEIAAWFELLLKNDYPDARVREIFYQKTHRTIIVELPREVEIEKYLGAYHYSQFHKNIPPDNNPSRTAYLYEYHYAKFGHPGNKNWSGVIPPNHAIPAGLLQIMKDPFPRPHPAPLPTSETPYARPVPAKIQCQLAIMRDVPLIASASDNTGEGRSMEEPPLPPLESPCAAQAPNVDSSSFDLPPTESLFTPYEPPSHYVAHVESSKSRLNQQEQVSPELLQVKKMDPYEEEEVERALLRSLSPVKKDESNEAVDFLNSFLPNIKSEEQPTPVFPYSMSREVSNAATLASDGDGDGDYEPSADLQELFNTLPTELSTGEGSSTARRDVVVKSEVLDTDLWHGDGDSSSDRRDIIVKSEVVETKLTHDEGYFPSDELLAAFANLQGDIGCNEQSIKPEPQGSASGLRVKEEPTEIQLSGRISSLSQQKQLPRDPRRSLLPSRPEDRNSDSQLSRDPRKRPSTILPIEHERNLEDRNAEDKGGD